MKKKQTEIWGGGLVCVGGWGGEEVNFFTMNPNYK